MPSTPMWPSRVRVHSAAARAPELSRAGPASAAGARGAAGAEAGAGAAAPIHAMTWTVSTGRTRPSGVRKWLRSSLCWTWAGATPRSSAALSTASLTVRPSATTVWGSDMETPGARRGRSIRWSPAPR